MRCAPPPHAAPLSPIGCSMQGSVLRKPYSLWTRLGKGPFPQQPLLGRAGRSRAAAGMELVHRVDGWDCVTCS